MVTTSNKSVLPQDLCVFRRQPEDLLSEVIPVWRSKAHVSGDSTDKWSKLDTRLQQFFKCSQFRDHKNNLSNCFATRSNDREFLRHLKDTHMNDVLYCVYCYPKLDPNNDYKNLDEVKPYNHECLVKHMKQCHMSRKYQCNMCLYRAVTVDHVNIHQSIYHTNNYGIKASNGRRECKIIECNSDNNPMRISDYFNEFVGRVALREFYQCAFCEFANKQLIPVVDHCVDNHPDYPILFHSPKRVRTTTEITVARDVSSEEDIQVLDHNERMPSTPSAKKMQDNRVSSTSHRERLLNASTERLREYNKRKAERDRVVNRFKYVGSVDRDGTRNKNSLQDIRKNASKGNTLQKLHQRIKDKKVISVNTRNIRHKNRNKLEEKREVHRDRNKLVERRSGSTSRPMNRVVNHVLKHVVNRGKFMTRYSEGSSDEDKRMRRAKSSSDEERRSRRAKSSSVEDRRSRRTNSSSDEDRRTRRAKSSDYDRRSRRAKSESDESSSESEEENVVKISDESNDSDVKTRNSSPESETDQFICVFCNQITSLKIRCKSHMESHFSELGALFPNYNRSKRVDQWIRVFAEKQNELALYDDCNTPGYESQYRYQCPICVKLAQTRKKQAKSFRNFCEVKRHFWTHIVWSPASCRVCDPPVELPNCDTTINKHLNSVHHNMLMNSDSEVINQLLGDKMRNSYTYRQRKAVENHFINVHHDSVMDEFINKQLDGIIATRERNLRILNNFPENLPSVSLLRLPDIDYNNENCVKKYLEAVKVCESRVNLLIREKRWSESSSDDDVISIDEERRKILDKKRSVDEMIALMNSLTIEKPVGCCRCKRAFGDLLDHNKKYHPGKAMMAIHKTYIA